MCPSTRGPADHRNRRGGGNLRKDGGKCSMSPEERPAGETRAGARTATSHGALFFAMLCLAGLLVLLLACADDAGRRSSTEDQSVTVPMEPFGQTGVERSGVDSDVPNPATVTVQELKASLEEASKPLVFDARSKASYEAGHIPGAISLPLDELDERVSEIPRDRLVIFYCSGST